jgi:hypothetical protein
MGDVGAVIVFSLLPGMGLPGQGCCFEDYVHEKDRTIS